MVDDALGKKPRRGGFWQTLIWRIESVGAHLFFGLFRILPLDAASACGGWLGRLIGPRLGVTKRAAINLRRAMPELDDAAARRILRDMWDNLGRVIGEYPHLGAFRVYEEGSRIEIVGRELVEPLLAAGKSIIFVSAHYGNWEIAAMAATQRGLAVAEIYRAANNPWIDRLVSSFRAAVGSELVAKGDVAARRSVAALREGKHLAILVDQKMNDGIAVPFFGRPAMTAPAVALLALRFDCAIVPGRVERLRGARFRLVLSPPIAVTRSEDRRADMLAIMTRINDELESWIRARPEMWLWLHRRWSD